MRPLLLLLLLALAAGAAAGLFLHDEAGYVLVSFGPWLLETSVLGFTLLASLVLFGIFYGAKGVLVLLNLPEVMRAAVIARRERRAARSFESGLQKLLEGQWAGAEVELIRRAADHHAPGLNYLLAARAAQRAGAGDRRDHYLELASRHGESSAFAAELLRAELMIQKHDARAALPVLKALFQSAPKHPYVIELLAESYARTRDWDPLRRLLSSPEGSRSLSPLRYRRLLGRALREELAQAAESARLDALKSMWEATPAMLRTEPELRNIYLRGLAHFGADTEAAAQIANMLKPEWDGDLAAIYGELTGIDPLTQLAMVESWVQQHGESPELLLAAGRVCTRARLWGKARSYLDAALLAHPSPAVYLALAQLCEQAKQPEEAAQFHRKGLELAARAR